MFPFSKKRRRLTTDRKAKITNRNIRIGMARIVKVSIISARILDRSVDFDVLMIEKLYTPRIFITYKSIFRNIKAASRNILEKSCMNNSKFKLVKTPEVWFPKICL